MKRAAAIIIALFFLLTVTASVHGEPEVPAAICASLNSGNWSETTIWSGCNNGIPQASDQVIIAAEHNVTLDTSANISSLTISGTLRFGAKHAGDLTLSTSGNITIDSGGTIDLSNDNAAHILSLNGDLINNGTFDGYGNRNRVINLVFNGGTQSISGGGTITVYDLTINSGTRVIFPAAPLLTVEGAVTVAVGGAVQQTQTVNGGPVGFLQISTDKYRGVDLTGNLGSTNVVITTTTSGGCTSLGSPPNYATRCYAIMPGSNVSATVRLWALTTTQLNGISQSSLRLYRYAGGWQQLTTNASTGSASGGYSYAQADTPGFSEFLLGGHDAPTAVTLSTLHAQPQATLTLAPIGLALMVGATLLLIKRRTR